MKNRLNPFLALLALATTSYGAALTWDADNAIAGAQDGGGTWAFGSGNWRNAATLTDNLNWTTGADSAIFGAGTDGTYGITVAAGNSNVGGVTFNNSGYTLSAAAPLTLTFTGTISVASTESATIGTSLTLNKTNGFQILGGGTLNITGTGAKVSSSGSNTSSILGGTTVNVGTGGTLTNVTSMIVGDTSGGALNVNGGTVSVTGAGGNFILNNSASGTVTVTLTSGAITNTQTAGTIRFGGSGTATGTFHLDGGILTGGRVFEAAAAVSSTFNFNGGTLKVLSGSANLANFMTVDTANVRNGGARIDSNGTNVTIAQALTHSIVGGDNPTDGGLTKEGTGTLTLTGPNTYTGATTINGGKIAITAPYSALTATTINNTGRLKVTSNGTSPSVLSNVAVNTGGGFEFDFGAFNAANQPAVSVGTFDANANFNVDLAGTIPFGSYTITLLNFTTKTGPGLPSIGTLPPGVSVTSGPAYVGSTIQIEISVSNQFTWSKGDGDWDTSSFNWNANAAAYAEPAVVTFPDLVEAVNGVNDVNVTSDRSPLAVAISNSGDFDTNAYSFSGTGGISGATGITKTGAGVVTFSNPNSFGGTLAVTGGHVIKAVPDTTSGNITVADTCTFALSGSITDGSGQTITLAGPGAATANIIAAATAVQRGSLQSLSGNNTWAGNIVLTGTAGTGGNTRIGVQTGASLTITGNITEAVTGMSPLFRAGDGVADTVTFSGTGSWTGPTRTFGGGALKLGGSDKLPTNAELAIGSSSGNSAFDLAGFNQTVAGISSSTIGGTNVLKNSGSASTLTSNPAAAVNFRGPIQDAVNLVVGGNAIQTLSGANTYTGNTTVALGGALTIAATTGELSFYPTAPSTSNAVGGSGTLVVDGKLRIDLFGADTTPGSSWTLVDVTNLNETFSATFKPAAVSLGDFTETALNSNIWKLTDSGKTWTFTEADGKLTVADAGYDSWADTNGVPGQAANLDHDNDGVLNGIEYFIGGPTGDTTGFTPVPSVTTDGLGVSSITWVKGPGYLGEYTTDFIVETSPTLEIGSWTPAILAPNPGYTVTISGSNVTYTFPSGPVKKFARLKVTGP